MKVTDLTERSIALMEARGLDTELAVRLGVRSCDRLGRDSIAIPYRSHLHGGRIVNWKYRTIPSKDKRCCMSEGGKLTLLNDEVIFDPSLAHVPLIITEGEFDMMIAMQAGYQKVVSVPNGAPPTHGTAMPWLQPYVAHLKQSQIPIILAVDGDPAGTNLLHDLSMHFGKPRCQWLSYPIGKDLGDVWQQGGSALVTETLSKARWVHVDGVYSLKSLPPSPAIKPYDTGFPGLWDHYRMRLHDLCIFTGIPGMGKTTWLNDLACRAVRNHGWHVALASFEQVADIDLKRSLRQWYGKKPQSQQSPAELDAADTWIDENFSLIVPGDDDEISMEWMAEKIATAILRHGAKLIIIDPFNELDIIPPPELSHTNYIGRVIRELKRIARKYRVHVIVAAHPTKLRADKDGKLPMPTLYDIMDSSHFANKADIGIVIHQEESGDTILKVAKSRYHDQIGRPGQLRMFYNNTTNSFEVRGDSP